MFDVSVNARDVARTFRVLRRVDNDLVKELRSGLRTELKPLAQSIAANYPSGTDLEGFRQTFGRWEWGVKVAGTVKVTPGRARKGAGRNNLVSLGMNFKGAVPYVVEMFGWRSKGKTPQARVLYGAIQRRFPGWPNGGRLFYKDFLSERDRVTRESVDIINDWTVKVNQELNSGD